VWPLPKLERLHICGWGMKFYKQHCYIFQVTHKVKQIKRLATSSVKNDCTHTSEAANRFSDIRWTYSCSILNERVCEVFLHLWLSWPITCMFLEYVPYMLCWINMRGWSGQSIHPISFALSVLIDTTSPARKGVFVHNHSPGPQHQCKGYKCLIDLISIVVPGQIFFKDGVQVSRTIIGDPTLTSNDAPHNLSCFWAQQSLNRSFYHHTCPQPFSKERNWPHQ